MAAVVKLGVPLALFFAFGGEELPARPDMRRPGCLAELCIKFAAASEPARLDEEVLELNEIEEAQPGDIDEQGNAELPG